jgi:hypothetical protein
MRIKKSVTIGSIGVIRVLIVELAMALMKLKLSLYMFLIGVL